MFLCIGVMLAGLMGFGVCAMRGRRKVYGIYCLILALSGMLGVLVCLNDTDWSQSDRIARPDPGEEAVRKEYVLSVEDLSISEPYQVTVENRHLTKQELENLFSEAAAQIEHAFLGENTSLDHITKNVELVDAVVDGSVEVSWSFDSYEAVNLSGELQEEALTKEGSLVQVTATMEYEGAQAEHRFSMMVYPPDQTVTEQFYELLEQELNDRNAKTGTELLLPEKVAGYALIWEKRPQKKQYQVLLMGLLAMAGVAIGRKEDARKAKEKRDEKLLAEYPQMLSQLALLLSAGMTVSHAWERIVTGYENRCAGQSGELQEVPVYEEMRITYHQMKDGLSERTAYEQFGERIRLQVYRRLATLLVQNLRKGTAGLSRLLEKEMQNAFEEQESEAKKRGEELQTKLLLPMMLMLGLVIVIIMIPAIASFQL